LKLTKKIAPELANLLDDDDKEVRKTAMRAFEQFRPASMACAPKIIQCLRKRPG
jgi:oligoendopeptidase F